MSADNGIARAVREVEAEAERAGFEIPPGLATRYEVRVVDATGGEQRLGLFRPGDRERPAIEITDNRIVARSEDTETVASLVKIAQHNGWDRIDVDGSPEFRKAVWTAATREGLRVTGYEPTFAEQERVETLRREDAARGDRPVDEQASPAARAAAATIPALSADAARDRGEQNQPAVEKEPALSDGDRRLLLTLSRHTEDRKSLHDNLSENMDPFQREVQFERIDVNRDALESALARALESPTLIEAFKRSGYEPDAVRQMGRDGEWDAGIADAIYLVRSGLHRDEMVREAGPAPKLVDELEADREDQAVAVSTSAQGPDAEAQPQSVREEQERHAATERRHESEELAELFLHGGAERVSAEPRLAGALQAQTAMEQHISEVFDGNARAFANLESRQLISDVLRRGLDVSVREPTPVRQIEPIQTYPDLER